MDLEWVLDLHSDLLVSGICREILGSGAIFGKRFGTIITLRFSYWRAGRIPCVSIFDSNSEAMKLPSATNVENDSDIACGGNCASCVGCASVANKGILEAERVAAKGRQKRRQPRKLLPKRKQPKKAKAKEVAYGKIRRKGGTN